MPKLTLDGERVEFSAGESLLEVAWRRGVPLPTFCYHPKLEPEASCRVCLVEVEQRGRKGLLPACKTPADEGMAVTTASETVSGTVQRGTLEFLLLNHPVECPVCDAGGECDLQNLAFAFGASESKNPYPRRRFPVPDTGPLIRLYPNRCILCTRCVRLYQDVLGYDDWQKFERGWNVSVGPSGDGPLASPLAGNLVDVCPLGAITDGVYRFGARPWETERVPATSVLDALGSGVYVTVRRRGAHARGPNATAGVRSDLGSPLRVEGRDVPAVNGFLISDRDRFAHGYHDAPDRLLAPQVRKGDGFKSVSWARALGAAHEALTAANGAVGAVTGARAPTEAALLAADYLRETALARDLCLVRTTTRLDPIANALGRSVGTGTLADIGVGGLILVVSEGLETRLPLVAHLVSRAARAGARTHCIQPVREWWTRYATLHQTPSERLADAALSLLAHSSSRTFSVGAPAPSHETEGAAALVGELADAERSLIVVDDSLPPLAQTALACLSAQHENCRLLRLRLAPNAQGFADAGFVPYADAQGVPQEGRSLPELLAAAADGEVAALVLWDADLLATSCDRGLVERALAATPFTLAVTAFDDRTSRLASLRLPSALPWETGGTFTSSEGRVSPVGKPLTPPPDSRTPIWLWAAMLRVAGRDAPENAEGATALLLSRVGAYGALEPFERVVETRPYPDGVATLRNLRCSFENPSASYDCAPRVPLWSAVTEPAEGEGVRLSLGFGADPCVSRSPLFPRPKPLAVASPELARELKLADGATVSIAAQGTSVVRELSVDERLAGRTLLLSPPFDDGANALVATNGVGHGHVSAAKTEGAKR